MRPVRAVAFATLTTALVACGSSVPSEPVPLGVTSYDATENWTRDIVATELDVSLATLTARATITLGPSELPGVSLEAAGLQIAEVSDADGSIDWSLDPTGRLDLGAPPSEGEIDVAVDYAFTVHDMFDGLLAAGSTLIWPYYCDNLFPCRSEPAEGLRFGLDVHDAPPNQTVVFPTSIPSDAPAYQLAWATGEYTEIALGTTSGGTRLSVWHLPGGDTLAREGSADLVAFFEFYENTLGPYPFGEQAGGVAVSWGFGALGGMEHHPFWHVSKTAMGDASVQAHEAAHGWFGDGVRIACWEDFVLSEGTVSYLTARAIEAVQGASAATTLWDNYQKRLDLAMASQDLKVAWPDSCGTIDILEDRLFSSIPYMKGAFFYRALEQRIGVAALDSALASFFRDNVGKAATMQQLLDHIQASAGYDPNPCAQAWLRNEAVPTTAVCP